MLGLWLALGAWANPSVAYVDELGVSQGPITEYTLVNADSAEAVTWAAGTYVVGADYNADNVIDAADAAYALAQDPKLQTAFTIAGGATAGGNVNIILTDGFTLTLDASATDGCGFEGNYKTINIYGQSGQSGTLVAKGGSDNGDGACGLGGSWNFFLNGGIVKAYGGDATEDDYFGGSGMYGAYINGGTVYGYGGKGLGCGPGGVGLDSCEIYNGAVAYGFGGDGGADDNGGDGVAMTTYDVPDTIEVHGTGGNGVCGGTGISFEDEAAGCAFYGIGGNGTMQGGAGIYIDCSRIDAGTFMAVGGNGETGGEGLSTGDGLVFSGGTLAITGGVGTVTGGCGISCGSITLAGAVIEVVAGAGAAGVAIDGTVLSPVNMRIIHGASAATAATLVRTEETDITADIEGDAYVKSTPPPPETASTVVTTLEDVDDKFDGKISLREAIRYADDTLGYDITFSNAVDWATVHPSLTISVASTIEFEKDVTIDGTLKTGETTVGKVTLDGGSVRRIMSDAKSDCVLNIRNMDFRNGKTSYGGGAINADGTLILANATFENNQESNYGGGAVCATSEITADNCTFRGNNGASGGALWSNGYIYLSNCVFDGNAATGNGGAICFRSGGKLVSVNNTFFGNTAARAGGAIYAESGAVLTLVNNTLTGNAASLGGDAVYLKNGSATLVNSILVGNAIARYASETITGYGVNIVDAASASLVTTAEDGSVTRTATKTEVFGTETPAAGPDGQVTVLANAKTEGVYVYGGASVAAALAWSADGVTKNYINGTTGADTRLNSADRIRDSKVYAGVGDFPAAYTIVLSEGEAYKDTVSSANKITAQVAAQGLTYVDGRWFMNGFVFMTSAETAVRFADAANAVSVVRDSSVAGGRYGFYLDGSLELSGLGSVSAEGAEAGVFGTVTSEPYAIAKSGETKLTWQKVNAEEPGFYAYTSGDPAVTAASVTLTARPPRVNYRDFADGGFVTAPLTNDYTLIKSDASASVTWSAGTYVVGYDYNMDGVLDYRDAEYAAENGLATTFNYVGAVVQGAVKLILVDGFTLTSKGGSSKAGVRVTGEGNSFTLYGQVNGTGRLNAIGGLSSAGIGSTSRTSKNGDAANITINGGTVTATGGNYGAGIGGGQETSASNITINAGTVIANGKGGGAGIGGGGNANFVQGVSHGSFITITGGKVTATSDGYAAAIGGGRSGRGRDIRITGGEVIANGGYFEKTSIGNGAKTNGVTTEPATNIFVDAQVILKADGNNPPKTLIAHASDADLSATLKGLRYVTTKDTAVARVGAAKFYTLQDALAAGNGKRIELVRDAEKSEALSVAAPTATVLDAMGKDYVNAAAFTNDGILTLTNSVAVGGSLTFGSIVNGGEIRLGYETDATNLLTLTGGFDGAAGVLRVDMRNATADRYHLIASDSASDYGTVKVFGEYHAVIAGDDLWAVKNGKLTIVQPAEGGSLAAYSNAVSVATKLPEAGRWVKPGETTFVVATPSNVQWQVEWVKTNDVAFGGTSAAAVDGATALPVTNVFAMATNDIVVTASFVVSDAYRAALSNVIENAFAATTNFVEELSRLNDFEKGVVKSGALDRRTRGTAAVWGADLRTPSAVEAATLSATNDLAEIAAKAKEANDTKGYDLVIASDLKTNPNFTQVVTNELGDVTGFVFAGRIYTVGTNAFTSFAAAYAETAFVPFVTNVHVFGCQTIASAPTQQFAWTLDLVPDVTAFGVADTAIVTVSTVTEGVLVDVTNNLGAVTGAGTVVLGVTEGTSGAAAYKAALEALVGGEDEVSVLYAAVEPQREITTNPETGATVTNETSVVTDAAKVDEAADAIVLPGVDTSGKVVVDVRPSVTNDVTVAGKLVSRAWDVVIVNETTNTLTVGGIEAKLNVLITNVTEVGKILTVENVIAGRNIQIENNGHLEAHVEATENITIFNSSVHTLVGTYRAGGDISISGEYGSLSNVVLNAVGTLAVSGTNVISGPVDFKADTIAYAIGTRTAWSVEGDNHTLSIDFEDVAKSTSFGIRIDAAQATGDICGTYVLATNALVATGFQAEVVGPDGATVTTLNVGDDPVYVGAKAFQLYIVDAATSPRHVDELVFTVSYGKFTVAYDAQDGRWSDGATVSNLVTWVKDGYRVPATEPTRAHYAFAGWYASWTNGAASVENGTPLAETVDHTIYAKWISQSIDPGAGTEVIAGQEIDGGKATIVTGAATNEQGEVSAPIANGELALPERLGNGTDGKFVAAIAAEAYAKGNYDDKVADAQKLTSVYLPSYVTRVGDAAFYACTNLTNVVFASAKDYKTNAKTTLELGSRAFANTAVETITFPVGTKTKLAAGAFANCPNLKEIFIYGDVACVKKGPFAGSGDGTTPITVHLSPTYAADKDFVTMLTASLNTSKVVVDTEPLGTVTITAGPIVLTGVTPQQVSFEFQADITSPWGAVNADTVTLFYSIDPGELKNFVGTGKWKPANAVKTASEPNVYSATFDLPDDVGTGVQFYRLTVGAER